MSAEKTEAKEKMLGEDTHVTSLGQRFGQIGDFWTVYDTLADKKDREMSKNLNENLDVLLIFAGLFSAINTAFISLSMPALSPDSSDETNALLRLLVLKVDNTTLTSADLTPPFSPTRTSIAANCLLYSSLSCSLLAAVGAMLGKEWLQSFDRTGQAGPREEQARFRQRKFNGAQQWHLEDIVQFLPYLLLTSVLFFFTGLIIFLLPTNKPVAFSVIAFFALGFILSCATIIAGAISSLCPYQTALSHPLRRVGGFALWCFKVLKKRMHQAGPSPIGQAVLQNLSNTGEYDDTAGSSVVSLFSSYSRASMRIQEVPRPHDAEESLGSATVVPEEEEGENDSHILNAQAASWLLEMTSNPKEQLTVAENICTLHPSACHVIVQESATWRRLLALTAESLKRWQDGPTAARGQSDAECFGAALYHSLIKYPLGDQRWNDVEKRLPASLFYSGTTRLDALAYAVRPSETRRPSTAISQYSLRKAALHTSIFKDRSTDWKFLAALINEQYDDALLSMLAFQVYDKLKDNAAGGSPSSGPHNSENLTALALKAYVGENVETNVFNAISIGIKAFADADDDSLSDVVAIYIAFLRKANDLGKSLKSARDDLWSALLELLSNFDWRPGVVGTKLVPFAFEALTTLKALHIGRSSAVPENKVFETLWRALDFMVVAAGYHRGGEIELKLDHMIIATLEWGTPYNRRTPLTGMHKHSRVVAYLCEGSQDERPSRRKQWVELIHKHRAHWFLQGTPMEQAWIDSGLGRAILKALSHAKTWGELERPLGITSHLAGSSPKWSGTLVQDGFIGTMVGVIDCINTAQGSFAVGWERTAIWVIDLLITVCEQAEGIPDGYQAAEQAVLALNGIFPVRKDTGILDSYERMSYLRFNDRPRNKLKSLVQRTRDRELRGGPPLSSELESTLWRLAVAFAPAVDIGPFCSRSKFIGDGCL